VRREQDLAVLTGSSSPRNTLAPGSAPEPAAAGFRSASTPTTCRPPLSPGILPGPVPAWGCLPASAAGTASLKPSAAPTATPRSST